jgi:diguanylate cyclase (GGDEF)-like protein
MSPTFEPGVVPADIEAARADIRRGKRGLGLALEAGLGVASAAGGAIGGLVVGAEPLWLLALSTGAAAMVVGSPFIALIDLMATRRGLAIGIENARQSRIMQVEAARRAFENQLARGLEMAEDEPAAFDVIRRALTAKVPDASVELLLADNSQAHLGRMVATEPSGDAPPGCPVDAPTRCVAARRAHTLVFADSEDLDACPLLRGRGEHRLTAVCVPVSIMGRTVGITHAVRDGSRPFSDEEIQALQSIANQAGNRLGVLRIMSETQLQASTDGLTGLSNRRSFENLVRRLRTEGRDFVVVMADLDHFKDLNDTYGHETGDRALRVFAQVLRDGVRADDIACRYGGEEFVIALPDTDVAGAIDVVERIRSMLANATAHGLAPAFTASFGIASSTDATTLEDLLHRADRALFAAKEAGRDCVCIDGHASPIASLAAFG